MESVALTTIKRRNKLRTIRIIGVAIALAGILVVGIQFRGTPVGLVPVVQAHAGCSNSSLRGNYGFQINGTIVGLGPIGGVALVTFDGEGNFTQTDNVSINGSPILHRPGSGTYGVNADCTGTQTLTFNVPGGQVVHTTFVIVGHGRQVLDVVTDPHVVITSVGKAVGVVDED
jgi:hypothetical protein